MLLPYCSARAEETRSDAREAMAPSEEQTAQAADTVVGRKKKAVFGSLSTDEIAPVAF